MHTAVETFRNRDLINGIKITAEINERCEYSYTLIGQEKHKNVKKRGRNKKTLKTFITSMLGATNVVITIVTEAV